MKRAALYLFVGSVATSALLAAYALLVGSFGEFEGKLLLTTLCISGGSILAMSCLPALERSRLGVIPRIGIVSAAIGFGLLIIAVWAEWNDDELLKFAVTAVLAGSAIAYSSLLSLVRLAPRFRWILPFGFACAGLLAVMLTAMVWEAFTDYEVWWRLTGVVSVLLCAATVIAPIFHRLSRSASLDAPAGFEPRLRFCPHCGAPASAADSAGKAACALCNARYAVHFDVSREREAHLDGVFK